MAIITISRGTFSGGKELAECVAKKLGYPCLAREVLVNAAAHYGVPLEKLQQAIEEKPGILERMTLERAHYLAFIRASLAKAARDEKLVYHGHAGHLLLRGVPHVLKVRVIAGMEYRIQAAMARKKLPRQKAIDFIKHIDENRAKWTKFLYHVDILDPTLYDVVFNIERIGVAHACESIALLAGREEFRPTAESRKALADLVLATEVRAQIALDGSVRDDDLEIEADAGKIIVRGSVHSLQESERITEIARKVPGVSEVISKVRPTYHALVRY